jgi:CRISPR/Cas system-associated exonuclease Cas4 (RecB family)
MRIEHKSEMVQNFAEIMMSDFTEKSKSRTGLHRSDVIACPLKCYWRLTGLIKPIYSSSSVGILLIGTIAHLVLHKNFDAQEKVFDLDGMDVTVDAILGEKSGSKIDFPIESKTTRKQIFRKEDLPEEWLQQLAIAMSVMGVDKGYLMIINVVSFAMTVWEISLSDEEREMFKKAAIYQKNAIIDAINQKKPELLHAKRSDCQWCPYAPMRKRDGDGCPYHNPLPREEVTR